MPVIKRVLVANRGEIALRIIRACRGLGLETVLAASAADVDSMPARVADLSLCIGPAPSTASYLSVGTIVEAARGSGSDAVHPGYGFLAERPELPQACIDNGLVFIGPATKPHRKPWATSWPPGRPSPPSVSLSCPGPGW